MKIKKSELQRLIKKLVNEAVSETVINETINDADLDELGEKIIEKWLEMSGGLYPDEVEDEDQYVQFMTACEDLFPDVASDIVDELIADYGSGHSLDPLR